MPTTIQETINEANTITTTPKNGTGNINEENTIITTNPITIIDNPSDQLNILLIGYDNYIF